MQHIFHLFFLYVFLFSIYLFFSVLSIAFPLHPKTQKKQIQNPNSKIQIKKRVCPGADAKASSRQAQTFEPLLTINFDEKIGLFAPCFFIFFLSSKLRFFSLCGSLGLPSHRKTLKKKSREFPLGGPSPCGEQD